MLVSTSAIDVNILGNERAIPRLNSNRLPEKAGAGCWVPAFAGMTGVGVAGVTGAGCPPRSRR